MQTIFRLGHRQAEGDFGDAMRWPLGQLPALHHGRDHRLRGNQILVGDLHDAIAATKARAPAALLQKRNQPHSHLSCLTAIAIMENIV
jgi:hypothetical protein